MRKIILSFFTTLLIVSVFAQSNDYRRPASIGVSFFVNDFVTAAEIKNDGLGSVIRDNQLFRANRLNAGVAINFLKGLSNHIDFNGSLEGSYVDYPIPNLPPFNRDALLLAATGNLHVKLLKDNFFIVPYADLGVGVSRYAGYYAAFIPVGFGLRLNFVEEAFITLNTQYRLSVTESSAPHLYTGLTIYGVVGKKREVAPKEVVMPVVEIKDRDSDGIVDSVDACPGQAGPASLSGCPDRDGDNIADKDDSCPDVAGLAKYKGCPIPDTDKDGINDEEDKCPDVAGVARYQGCPIPDTDKDGINDEEDKCPNEIGPASNFGCPEIPMEVVEKINLAARNIFFATGSSKLLAKSYPSLNNVVKIMQDNPSYKVDIAGHTDTTGTAEKNHVLSHDRANAVKAYLISKSIDESRIKSEGFGFTMPIASNKTAAGKAKNRRVEMKLKNY